MKMKLMLIMAIACFIGATVSAAVVELTSVADSYIHFNDQTANFGTETTMKTANSGAADFTSAKSYIRFDASGLGTITELVSLDLYISGVTSTRWLWYIMDHISQTDGSDVAWDETTITWENAPGNNVGTTNNREFVAGEGEQVSRIGAFIKADTGWKTLSFEEGVISEQDDPAGYAANIDALINALNTGDRTVTIGLAWANSFNQITDWGTRESDYAPSLSVTVIPEPATLVLLGLGGLSLLRKRK